MLSRTRSVAAAGALILGGSLAACSAAQPATADTVVCQHYLAQRAWVKGLTFPTEADAIKFIGYLAADKGQATGTLQRQLSAMLADDAALRSSYAASTAVLDTCQKAA